MNKKSTTKFVIIFIGSLITVSVILAWIMAQNYTKDTSKERKALNEALKKVQKESFDYNPERGLEVYTQFCLRCHGAQGQGTVAAPPLAGSELATADKSKILKVVIHGMRGKIERNGKVYDLSMPGFPMITHKDLAHVLSYVRSSFGNEASEVTPEDVLKIKIDHVERDRPWTEEEL